MVAIHSLASLLAMTLMVNAAPAELVTRGDPGSSAGQARFFAAGNTKCDQGGQAIVQADFFYPPAPKGNTGIIVNVATGSCNAIGPYGSVVIDFLQPGCVFEKHLSGLCVDTPVANITAPRVCNLGEVAPANFYRVVCT